MSQDAVRPPDSYWEPEIAAFEAADRRQMPPPGGVVFVGSSTFTMWATLQQDFPELPVVRRGFGGSELSDSVQYADRIILPYKPKMVVVYAGDNDLAGKHSPQRVADDFRALVGKVHAALPAARVVFLAIKPSPSRWHLERECREANRLVREICEAGPLLTYVDVFTPMLGADGKPRADLFLDDRLHMNRRGYELWIGILRPVLKRLWS